MKGKSVFSSQSYIMKEAPKSQVGVSDKLVITLINLQHNLLSLSGTITWILPFQSFQDYKTATIGNLSFFNLMGTHSFALSYTGTSPEAK